MSVCVVGDASVQVQRSVGWYLRGALGDDVALVGDVAKVDLFEHEP